MANAKHTQDLLPCPFCGSSGAMLTNSGGYIECLLCNAFGPTVNVSRGGAERYWNARATPAREATEDLVEAAHNLSIEVLGQMEAFEIELRQVLGNSNFTSLAQRAFEAEAAIARAKGGS